jgi:hypothetical protein
LAAEIEREAVLGNVVTAVASPLLPGAMLGGPLLSAVLAPCSMRLPGAMLCPSSLLLPSGCLLPRTLGLLLLRPGLLRTLRLLLLLPRLLWLRLLGALLLR